MELARLAEVRGLDVKLAETLSQGGWDANRMATLSEVEDEAP